MKDRWYFRPKSLSIQTCGSRHVRSGGWIGIAPDRRVGSPLLMRQGERASAHVAAPEISQSQAPPSGRPARSRRRGTRGTYLQTCPSAVSGNGRDESPTHKNTCPRPYRKLGVSRRCATPVCCASRCRTARSHAMGRAPRIPGWRAGRYGSRHGSALTDPT